MKGQSSKHKHKGNAAGMAGKRGKQRDKKGASARGAMTFAELADRLGVPRSRINTHPKGTFFPLPWLPLDRFKEIDGCMFRGRFLDKEVIYIPVEEGAALVCGTVRREDDGSQVLVDAVTVLKTVSE